MIRYYLNGTECNPKNKDSVNYVFDFTDRQLRELELSVDTLEFVREDFDAIKQWISIYGYVVGMPLDIKYSNGQVVKYLLDFSDPSFTMQERGCKVKLKRYKAIDNFFDNANGLSFGTLQWNNSEFTNVDYVVIPEQQGSYYLSLALATFALVQELQNAIQEIAESAADLTKALVPVGLPVPAPDFGAIAVAVIKLAARIAYALAIIIALVKLGIEIINIIFQPIRQFRAATIYKLVSKGCQHLGYTLSSTLLASIQDLTILPVPLKPKDPNWFYELLGVATNGYTNGYPSSRDTAQTLGQLITIIENTFNAKTIVKNGVVTIEHETYFEKTPNTGFLSAFNLQDQLQSEYKLNSEQQFKRMLIQYQVDPSDFNTFDDTKQNLYEISSEPINTTDRASELIKGFDLIDIPFARGTNKGKLNFLETAAKALAKSFDTFTGGSLSAKIEARKNVLQISSQYFNVTKLLAMNGSRLNSNQYQRLGCDVLAAKYWYSRYIQNNQKHVFENIPIAMTETELFQILDNNYIVLNNGKVAEITNIQWSEVEHYATATIHVREQAINVQTTIIDNGN
jgi:hypothetical protein